AFLIRVSIFAAQGPSALFRSLAAKFRRHLSPPDLCGFRQPLTARAAAAASGLDRFEERHWRELEKQLGIATTDPPDLSDVPHTEATHSGGLAASGVRNQRRRLIRSRWLT
ncbi:MAG: hypothetical protein WBO95_17650, partial [Candidatus Dechloromonas phosphoritropha]